MNHGDHRDHRGRQSGAHVAGISASGPHEARYRRGDRGAPATRTRVAGKRIPSMPFARACAGGDPVSSRGSDTTHLQGAESRLWISRGRHRAEFSSTGAEGMPTASPRARSSSPYVPEAVRSANRTSHELQRDELATRYSPPGTIINSRPTLLSSVVPVVSVV